MTMTRTHTRTHTFTQVDFVKPLVKAVLVNADRFEWSLQGFGMLRTYLDDERNVRLHVWDHRFRTEAVDSIHTHPWNFHSFVVAGVVHNMRYRRYVMRNELGQPFREQEILCGPGGHETATSHDVTLVAGDKETYKESDSYSQLAHEIHASDPVPGTVTVIVREFLDDTEHAYVYIPLGQEWVSAEPRRASTAEVQAITQGALKAWF